MNTVKSTRNNTNFFAIKVIPMKQILEENRKGKKESNRITSLSSVTLRTNLPSECLYFIT